MAAGLIALGDDGVRAGSLRAARFGERGRRSKPSDAFFLESSDEVGREDSHDGGNRRGTHFEEGLALRAEVGRCGIASRRWHFRSPAGEELAHASLGRGIPRRGWIGNPSIKLNWTAAL